VNKNCHKKDGKICLKLNFVSLPEDLHIPKNITSSKVRIPSTYTDWEVKYENERREQVNKNDATHLRFTGTDKRSDLSLALLNQKE